MEKNKITRKDIEKYYQTTSKAFEIVKKNISKGKNKQSREIINMVENYLKDSIYFKNKGDLINSFGAIYYSHGWIDCGVRLGIFNVSDNKLFTIK
ncbi:MAG: DUF357 domain-containing protein [Nanoarchaeota archaeon]